jgi:hypothetical protein
VRALGAPAEVGTSSGLGRHHATAPATTIKTISTRCALQRRDPGAARAGAYLHASELGVD